MVTLLSVHPSRAADLLEHGDSEMRFTDAGLPFEQQPLPSDRKGLGHTARLRDRFFEEIDLLRLVSADVVANPLLGFGQRRRSARLRCRGIRR